jgi:hypothetical protein
MGLDTENRAPTTEARSQNVDTKTDEKHVSRHSPKSPTQKERVLAMLRRGWVCGVDFLGHARPPIVRYTGRIHELRNDGYQIDRRPCQAPFHDHGPNVQMWQWKLVGEPGDPTRLPGIG